MTLSVLLYLVAVVTGGVLGGEFGFHVFGIGGAIAGGIMGAVLGHAVGLVPEWLSTKLMFRHIRRSSDDELWKIVSLHFWNFYQTLALLQLAARGHNVRTQLPRIAKMLESSEELERVYGWDALRLVFPPETEMMAGYNPRGAVEDCRNQAAKLKEIL